MDPQDLWHVIPVVVDVAVLAATVLGLSILTMILGMLDK